MFSLRPLVSFSFWFDKTPPALLKSSARIIFAAFAILFTLGVIVRMVAAYRTHDRFTLGLFRRIGRLCVTLGLVGLLLFFFSYEQIPFFSMRFWYVLWGIGLLGWIFYLVRWAKRIVPGQRASLAERVAREKYLPKPKSR